MSENVNQEWQPIDTVPPGVDVLLYLKDGRFVVGQKKIKCSTVWTKEYPQGKTTN